MSLFSTIAPIAGPLLGGLLGSRGASKAAKAQTAAARDQVAFATETRDLTRADLSPFYQSGVTGYNALLSMLGLGEAPIVGGELPEIEVVTIDGTRTVPNPEYDTWINQDGGERNGFRPPQTLTEGTKETAYRVGGKTFSTLEDAEAWAASNRVGGTRFEAPVKAPWDLTLDDFEASPGYNFRLNEGLRAVEGSSAARHGLNSGATLNALSKFGQDYGSAEYGNFYNRRSGEFNNYLSRLTGVAAGGQNAAAGMGAANATASGQVNNAFANMGNAQAAGAVGSANAWNDAIGNALSGWQYNQLLDTFS